MDRTVIAEYLPQLWDSVLTVMVKYWPQLAAVAAFMSAIVTRPWFCRDLKDRMFLRKCIPALKKYFEKERTWLSARPSLIATSTIDFASGYVELVMIAQPHRGMSHAKRVVDVEEVLAANNPAVIVSAAGCGKTTLLLHMHYLLLEAQANRLHLRRRSIPIFLEAKEIVHHDTTLSKQISTKLTSLDEEKAQRFVEIGLKRGLFVLLIDGIDVISEPIPGFLKKIRDFVTENPCCHVILASRPVSYDLEALTENPMRPFSEIAIAPLSYEKRKALVEKYAHSADHARRVLQAISTRAFLKEITRVAINLLLCIEPLASCSEELTKRSDFYRIAVRTLLWDWPKRNGVRLEYTTPDKMELLSHVCFAELVDDRPFNMDTVSAAGSTSAECLFEEIQRTSGLIRVPSLGNFEFPHRTFEEYFAALYIVDHFDRITNEEWTRAIKSNASEIIAFAANLLKNVEPLVERVMTLSRGSSRLLSLAQILANSHCGQLSASTQEVAEDMIWQSLQDSPDVHVQSSAARHVLSLIHQFPRPAQYKTLYLRLVEQLATPGKYAKEGFAVDEVQTQALRFLVHTSSPEIVARLVEVFDENSKSDTYVRFKAGELLARLSSEELLPELRKAYEGNDDADVRQFVTEAIVRTKANDALRFLKEVVANDKDLVIRDLATEGLSQIEGNYYLEDATIVINTGGEKSVQAIIPGSDLSAEDVLTVAADRTSPYRLDAFFRLRDECPEGAERVKVLFDLATDPTENEYYRCEAVRLIGTRTTPNFADYLEKVFKTTRQEDPAVGAGARGCAIEYLAHRRYHEGVFTCINDCDMTWRLSSERCKIVWSLWEVLRIEDVAPTNRQLHDIRRVCAECELDKNPRVHWWRKKILQRISTFSVSEGDD